MGINMMTLEQPPVPAAAEQEPAEVFVDAFFEGLVSGDVQATLAVIDANPEKLDKKLTRHGSPPLCLASRHGHAELVAALLERGADLIAEDEQGKMAIHNACDQGHIECARLLGDALEAKKWLRPMLRRDDKA